MGVAETLSRTLSRLPEGAILCLPESMDNLPLLSLEGGSSEEVRDALTSTRNILRRALAFVDFRQREKVQFSEEELLRVQTMSDEVSTVSDLGFFWDANLKRIDAAQYDHCRMDDDWKEMSWGEGAALRRPAMKKGDEVVACLQMELQWRRNQYLLLHSLEHPALPGSMEQLLQHVLETEVEAPTIVMCVRERREQLWKLLRKHEFKAIQVLRNFYRTGADFQDGFLMRYERKK